MKATGHTSVQMHKRYVNLQREGVATAFGTGPKIEVVDRNARQEVATLPQ